MGVILAIFLPDTPASARFLTIGEKAVAIERTRANQHAPGAHDYKLYQVKEAFLDPMVSLGGSIINKGFQLTACSNYRHGFTLYTRLR